MKTQQHDLLKVGLAQISPVWLNKKLTLEKVSSFVDMAGKEGCDLVAFGEAIAPGYPFWLELTGGARFNDPMQKEMYAYYAANAINIGNGDLSEICRVAAEYGTSIYLGTIERAADRGGHSLYCSLVFIDGTGTIRSVHRKLRPTYEERLVWSPGDGHGLRVHPVKGFTVGGLNCWENWMPMPRTALYAQGENLHVAVWPGSIRNTEDITRFIAKESRSYVMSVSALMTRNDFPVDTPHLDKILENAPEHLTDGGSCLAGPDGKWIIEPVLHTEGLFTAEITLESVFEERQNLDVSGHYSRPDVLKLSVNRERQNVAEFFDQPTNDTE